MYRSSIPVSIVLPVPGQVQFLPVVVFSIENCVVAMAWPRDTLCTSTTDNNTMVPVVCFTMILSEFLTKITEFHDCGVSGATFDLDRIFSFFFHI